MYIEPKETGKLGEEIAENYLKGKGYKILNRNYQFKIPKNPKIGEIDIVARKGDTISFIEVKTLRSFNTFISPEEKVDFKKGRNLIKTAEYWLTKNKIPLNSKWQIDVISVRIKKGKAKISHFENAISASRF